MKNPRLFRNADCCVVGCVDLFICLSITVACINMMLAVYEVLQFNLVRKIINTSLFGFGALLCLCFALPCWSLNPKSSNVSGMYGLILMGHALGYGLAYLYVIYTESYDVGPSFEILKDKITIIGFSICGFCIIVLAMIHEFGIKYNCRLSCSYIFSYIIFASIIAVSGIICWAFAVPLIDNFKWFWAEKHLQPLIVTAVFRCGSAIAIFSCLIRSFGTSIWSSFLLLLMFVCNISMLVVAAAQFRFSPYSDWFGYGPGMKYHNEVLGLWILTTSLVGFVAIVNKCFYPTPKLMNFLPNLHNDEQQRDINAITNNCRTHDEQQQQSEKPILKPIFIIPDGKDGQLTPSAPTFAWV